MPKIPIYVLMSRFTFSCAEDFAFCLQNLGRATIIGETTRGGAHDAKLWAFPAESVSLQIPFNEAVDPRTKKTWEKEGDDLYLYSNDGLKQRLAPIASDDFKMVSDDRHGFAQNRLRFTRDGSGRVKEMFIRNQDGNRFPVRARK